MNLRLSDYPMLSCVRSCCGIFLLLPGFSSRVSVVTGRDFPAVSVVIGRDFPAVSVVTGREFPALSVVTDFQAVSVGKCFNETVVSFYKHF